MGIQNLTPISKGIKVLSMAILAQGLIACGSDGLFSGERSFANKNLSAIEVNENDEGAMGLDSMDIESGEEVTSIEGDGQTFDQEANEEGSTENASGDEEAGDYEDGTEGGENAIAENCPGKSKCNGNSGGNGNGKKDDDYDKDYEKDPDAIAAKGGGNYICILEGPGKSIRLGLTDDSPAGQTGTPDVICMSQSACLGEVSKAFDVKLAHKRGFCPNKNPHVIQMSDEEVALMVEKALE